MAKELCWCGLLQEHHDGRELDCNNDLHRFNEPVRAPSQEFFEDRVEETKTLTKPITDTPTLLLLDIKRLLQTIVLQSQNGAKIPGNIVNKAASLSIQVNRLVSAREGEENKK